jgi:hypothetical protein
MRSKLVKISDYPEGQKWCYKCESFKEKDSFYNDKSTVDGKAAYCKKCKQPTSKKWITDNREASNKHKQTWRERNREQDLANKAKYRKDNREKLKESYRDHILKKKYGITRAEYDAMLLSQNGVCAICKQTCSTGKSLAVDHNHETDKIRALLCRDCNITLGLMKEDAARLRAAALYLETYNRETNE